MWQSFLNEVLTYHYSISPPHRSSLTLLKGIERATSSFPIASCDSPVTYYKMIAKMTDYLLRFVANDLSFVHILDEHDALITASYTSDTCVVPSCMNVFVVDSFSLLKAISMFEQNFNGKPREVYIYQISANRVLHFLLTKHAYQVS
ncbi:diverged REC-like domain-containing protein [Anoxybacillus gonensis]|uniref:Diverged REC-like domain-containing protein n=1 Tax=Anoxybacillus gonensis TaxID=198467 RepID=A0AAW7TGA2_9BACL|nr:MULTISPECIES: hypothetical protein [Anoxybacillus]AKS39335.1 diverged REC-like domain-containing protein [Anoxybacillus gonensis]KGP62065.1 diverged REC-like domain-containing protein [Anoxybacillus gonensis]MCQ5364781.1 diverged REC-like domain-containing protein [Anoxybacillus gonensis]MDO0877104.1 diverged REC-like domain-containing protein [Anoxybacillus gonensis]